MIRKKKIARNLDLLQKIVDQNSRTSQSFCNEQLQINKIVSKFKEDTELKIRQLE
jgi:hypothetical protein